MNRKLSLILLCLMTIIIINIGNEIKNLNAGEYRKYTAEEQKKLQSEFDAFRKSLIERLDKAKSILDLKDVFYKGKFYLKNDYKKIQISYKEETDLEKINSEIEVKALRKIIIIGELTGYGNWMGLMPYNEREYPLNLYPNINFLYDENLQRWFISDIAYLEPDRGASKNPEYTEREEALITGDNVNVREASKVNSKVLIQLNKNDKIVVIGKTNELVEIGGEKHYWYKIGIQKNENYIQGWVFGKFIKILDGK